MAAISDRAILRHRASAPGRIGTWAQRSPWPWLLPALLVLGLFYLYPILDVFRFAFTDATLLGDRETYTLGTIVTVLTDPNLPTILFATTVFTAFSVIGQIATGFAIALLVIRGERRRLYGMSLLRTVVLVAWVVPGIANGLIWQMLFSEAPFGAINSTLRLLHIAPVAWLSDPGNAMMSAVISNVWRGTAFSMVLLYAGLKVIDRTLYEAPDIDGAGSLQMFRFITLPQMRVTLRVNAILITIQTLNTFDAIISLTGGGPGRATEVISLFAFNTVFRNHDLAGGAVLSVLMLVISLVLSLVYAWFLPQGETSE